MAVSFSDAINTLMSVCPAVKGVAFTDLDGEDIAVEPREERETLRLCAAYNGIALRRLSTAESDAGRGGIRRLVLRGTTGTVISMKVGDAYQLVIAADGTAPTGQILHAADTTVRVLEAGVADL